MMNEPNSKFETQPADFGLRFAAVIIDGLIQLVFLILLARFLYKIVYFFPTISDTFEAILIGLAILLYIFGPTLLRFTYGTIFDCSVMMGTPGKIVVGIKVCDALGYRLTVGQSIKRNLARILSGLILGIGFLMALFNKDRKTLHDEMTNTQVIIEPHDHSAYRKYKKPSIIILLALIIVPFFIPSPLLKKTNDPRVQLLKNDRRAMTTNPADKGYGVSVIQKQLLDKIFRDENGEPLEQDIKYYSKRENNKILLLVNIPWISMADSADAANINSSIYDLVAWDTLSLDNVIYSGLFDGSQLVGFHSQDTSVCCNDVNKQLLLEFYDEISQFEFQEE